MASSAAGNAGKDPQARCANAFEVAQVRAGRVPGRSKTLFDFPMVYAHRRSVLFSKAVTCPWTPYFHDAFAP
jgi:hypothetical protein